MKWFNTVKGTVKKTAGIAYEKSSQLVEITKINYKISEAEAKVDKTFGEIGAEIYTLYKAGAEISEEIKILCESVESKYLEIETLKSQLEEIKEIQVCKSCFAKNSAEAKFCSSCGEKLDN